MENEGAKIIKTFTDFDKFGLEPFANQLTKYLQVESQFVDGSFVLSLNSGFGSGKSTFFEMWKNQLDTAQNMLDVVCINAWESDFQGDPLLAIISQLLKLQPTENSKTETSIKETAGKLGKFALSLGNDFVCKFTGLNLINAAQYAESKDGIATPSESGKACFELYEEKQALFDKLKKQLGDLAKESKYPILIIVDELDRCRPTYAIEFLETIKHFFDIKRLIFVLGVDKEQLASSAKALFGQQLNFDEYYRKFAHRNITLPVNTQPMIEKFCKKLVAEYLSQEAFKKKNRFSYAEHNSHRVDNIVELCMVFSLNARQMHESFRILAYILSVSADPKEKLLWGWHIGTFFMATLSIKYPDIYRQIGNKEIVLSELTAFLKSLTLFGHSDPDTHDGSWWGLLLYLGIFGKLTDFQLQHEFTLLGIWNLKDMDIVTAQNRFKEEVNSFCKAFSDWGGRDFGGVFSEIYKRIEEMKTFEKE